MSGGEIFVVIFTVIAWGCAGLAALPVALLTVNLFYYRAPRRRSAGEPGEILPPVSVLIPARDEEATIGASVEAVLASRGVELEVVVLDDHSNDRTAEIVRELAARDGRVRLVTAPALPSGWNGKQHACWRLAHAARHDLFVFLDADVRLAPDALERLAGTFEDDRLDLLSGVPRQETGSLVEKLVVPFIHVLLLGYLPMPGMRRSRRPSFAAGCGQLFLARRSAYASAGGHAAIRGSRHDGLKLPRAFRDHGLKTDLADVTSLATCRMYRGGREVVDGFAKNAEEGMASPVAIGPWTVLLLGGHVLPFVLLALATGSGFAGLLVPAVSGVVLGLALRLVLAARFEQSLLGAVLHPVGALIVVAIQWVARARSIAGRPVAWKGRVAT